MQTGQHLETSQRFLDDALMLESVGSHMGAGEMIWGAVIQALEAIDHIGTGNATGSLSSNGRRRLVDSVISDGVNRYNRIQNEPARSLLQRTSVTVGVRRQHETRSRLRHRTADDCLVAWAGHNRT